MLLVLQTASPIPSLTISVSLTLVPTLTAIPTAIPIRSPLETQKAANLLQRLQWDQ